MVSQKSLKIGGAVIGSLIFLKLVLPSGDVLNGYGSTSRLGTTQLEITLAAFCMSPLPAQLMKNDMTVKSSHPEGEKVGLGDFKDTGDMAEDSYSKGSIYSLLYSLYASAGTVKSDKGVDYEFTFNTWGVSPTPGFPDTDPQRFGKAAYAGLAQTPAVAKYIEAKHAKRGLNGGAARFGAPLGSGLTILEVGSGTGAGAHLIAGELLPGAHYYALDMQAQATATCNRRHDAGVVDGTKGTANVTCVHVPKGVGNGDSPIVDGFGKKMPSGSIDIVIICETHIAATQIGPEEEAIFAEIHRVLAPGGLFLWGNALPTPVWVAAPPHVSAHGFNLLLNENVTKGAVEARDLDAPRVNAFVESLRQKYFVFRWLGHDSTCAKTSEMLVKNFYRHPGTALYNTMVTGHDTYARHIYQKHDGNGKHFALEGPKPFKKLGKKKTRVA